MKDQPLFHVDNIPDVNLALNLVGIDATLEEVQQFISLFSSASITQGDVNYVRKLMKERDPGKRITQRGIAYFSFHCG